jgi:hypothetical protein
MTKPAPDPSESREPLHNPKFSPPVDCDLCSGIGSSIHNTAAVRTMTKLTNSPSLQV